MATTISLDEYLRTTYEPDMEYLDGVLMRRNVGTQKHGRLQVLLGAYLVQFEGTHRVAVFADTRLLVSRETSRYRIPDIMVLEDPFKEGSVVTDIPAVIIEIKSPDDTLDDVMGRCLEYASLGVPNIAVLDPDNKRQFVFQAGRALQLVESIVLHFPKRNIDLPLPVADMFAKVNREPQS